MMPDVLIPDWIFKDKKVIFQFGIKPNRLFQRL